MECQMCGCEPYDPTSLRPVREPVTITHDDGSESPSLGDEIAVCEDCWPEASEPERSWRLANECPTCWRPKLDVGEPVCICPGKDD